MRRVWLPAPPALPAGSEYCISHDFVSHSHCPHLLTAPALFLCCAVSVIDPSRVTKDSKLERINKRRDELTSVGRTCLERAIIEGERRFCGSDAETITDKQVIVSDRELLATLVDVRTKGAAHLSPEQRRTAKAKLVELHQEFAAQRDAKAAEAAAEAARGATEAERARNDRPAAAAATSPPCTPPRDEHALMYAESAWTPPDASNSAPARAEESRASEERLREKRLEEATFAVNNWLKSDIDLVKEFPAAKLPQQPRLIHDLIDLPLGEFYLKLREKGTPHPQYGYIPLMASSSSAQLGSLMAESFCERMLSCANLVMTEGNTLLGDAELEKLVILKMNANFMTYMRQNYPRAIKDVHSNWRP